MITTKQSTDVESKIVNLSSQLPPFLANKGFALRPFAFIRAKHCLVKVNGNSWIVSTSVANVVIFTVRMWTLGHHSNPDKYVAVMKGAV